MGIARGGIASAKRGQSLPLGLIQGSYMGFVGFVSNDASGRAWLWERPI